MEIEKKGLVFESIIKSFRQIEGVRMIVIEKEFEGKIYESWYPIKDEADFKIGDQIVVTPIIKEHPSGGSLTIFKIGLDTNVSR